MRKALHIIRTILPELHNNPALQLDYDVDWLGEIVLRGRPFGPIATWTLKADGDGQPPLPQTRMPVEMREVSHG